jgi:hypothetical protein
MAGRSSASAGLPCRGLRGAGRAVRMCMRCAVHDNTITITITTSVTTTTTTTTTMAVLTSVRT